ncbi:hypothetical protein GCM10023224_09200 [Streptomonospora halophila]|uniref:DUF3105 domain-containing protein n=1 Tax=Streptomonospora halophila TaxID=427369 RepID=A0ABP9G7V1_9ACTN
MVPPESNPPHQPPQPAGAQPPPGGAGVPGGPEQPSGPQHAHPHGAPPGQGGYGPPHGYPQGPPPGPPGRPPHGYGPPPGGGGQKGSSGALWWVLGGCALVLVLVVVGGGVAGYLFLRGGGGSAAPEEDLPGSHRPGDIAGVRTFTDVPREHTEELVSYEVYPPPGGKHHPVWQNCGVYRKELKPEHAVHSLEHGAVWVSYKDNQPGDVRMTLEGLYREGDYLLVSPAHTLQRENIVLVAWGKRLVVDEPDDHRIAEFLNTYVQGPQTPEPGAPCSGGTDETLETA